MATSPNSRTRTEVGGHGHLVAAQGRRRFHSRPGQLHRRHQAAGDASGAVVRSPYAHARIKSIDKSNALAWPGVVAVLTADDLKPVNLHWMPTLGGDVQAVLADKKVCFQMQEVAMVLASDRYAAADGAALVEVDYEKLPAIVDPKKAMDKDAPIIPRISPTRRKSATARAPIRITSSPGKPATRPPPMPRSKARRSRCARRS